MNKRFTIIAIAILLPIYVFGQTAKECYQKGVNYYYGKNGVPQNYAEAVKWWRKAADQGHTKAQFGLGYCYYFGRGVTKDYAEAVKWYRKAAEQGYSAAQAYLGYCYFSRRGVTKDYAEAVKWFRKAAEQGNEEGQNGLGVCYEYGEGVTQNYAEAVKWYRKAAEQGYAAAKTNLANIEKKIAEQQENGYAKNTTTMPQQQSQITIQPQPKIEIDIVDNGIPVSNRINNNTFAIIIANEDYQGETKVEYAKNDGEVFKSYCHKTLGLPEKNVHYIANATRNNIVGELYWLSQVCDAFKGDASVIFYYAGHGLPDEDSGSAYLLPVDGNSQLIPTCYSINELYETLGKLPAKKVAVLMDACFSGAKRNGWMLASARGVAIKAKESTPQGNMIVLSAAQGNETAYKYEEAKHGLFTYFLLKKLKETKGNVTMGELGSYLQDQVGRYSIVENGKRQTPSVQTSDKLKDNWESLKFD